MYAALLEQPVVEEKWTFPVPPYIWTTTTQLKQRNDEVVRREGDEFQDPEVRNWPSDKPWREIWIFLRYRGWQIRYVGAPHMPPAPGWSSNELMSRPGWTSECLRRQEGVDIFATVEAVQEYVHSWVPHWNIPSKAQEEETNNGDEEEGEEEEEEAEENTTDEETSSEEDEEEEDEEEEEVDEEEEEVEGGSIYSARSEGSNISHQQEGGSVIEDIDDMSDTMPIVAWLRRKKRIEKHLAEGRTVPVEGVGWCLLKRRRPKGRWRQPQSPMPSKKRKIIPSSSTQGVTREERESALAADYGDCGYYGVSGTYQDDGEESNLRRRLFSP